MADHLTEEEQIEALKNWWSQYWLSVVAPIVLVAGGYYGWNVWKENQRIKAETGGARFQELLAAMETAPGMSFSPEQVAGAQALANDIADNFAGSLYADHANMILARLAVDEGDLQAAEAYLLRVIEEGANAPVKALATARLARVKNAQGQFDQALALLSGAVDEAQKAVFAEIRADALVGQGKLDAARTAYQDAIDNLPANQFNRMRILELKRDGVAITATVAAPAEDVPAPETSDTEDGTEENGETVVDVEENS